MMNSFLDLVVCGQAARLCGGVGQLYPNEEIEDVCSDKRFWNALIAGQGPPIPKIVEISRSSESDDDSLSLLSELEISNAFKRHQDGLTSKQGHASWTDGDDLLLQEEMVEESTNESLAVSSFDSRMGDTRNLEMEDEEMFAIPGTGKTVSKWDDQSSYSSFYFRLRPENQEHSQSWQTTSTRTTRSARNPPRFQRYN